MTPKQALDAAIKLRRLATEVDEIGVLLDDDGIACDACGTLRYGNWPQKQLKDRVMGASQRLREITDVFGRRHNDKAFLGEVR